MPKPTRTRPASAAQVRAYLGKAEEFLEAAGAELDASRPIAATSLAIHAAINAADAVCGTRTGRRAAGQDHDEVLRLLAEAGKDGADVHRERTPRRVSVRENATTKSSPLSGLGSQRDWPY